MVNAAATSFPINVSEELGRSNLQVKANSVVFYHFSHPYTRVYGTLGKIYKNLIPIYIYIFLTLQSLA